MNVSPYELARKLEAAREFDVATGAVKFRFRVPSELRFLELLGSIPADQARSISRQAAVFTPACLVGWSGIRARDLDADQGEEELMFSPELVEAVLDRYSSVIVQAYTEIVTRYQARKSAQEAEVKN